MRRNNDRPSMSYSAQPYTPLMKQLLFVVVLLASACGGSKSPTAPSTPPVTPVPPTPPAITTITGNVMATNGGQMLQGVSVVSSTSTVQTDASGAYVFRFTGAGGSGSFPVTIEGPGIVTRQTRIGLNSHAVSVLGVFSLNNGFDLTYYRNLARGAVNFAPPRDIRPWTRNPIIYIHTVDDRDRALDPQALAIAESTIRETIGAWTGGRLRVDSVEYGNEDREARAQTISVTWGGDSSDYCGRVTVPGFEGTVIELDTRTPGCRCAGLAVDPAVVRHELGHALGYYHTTERNDLMFPIRSGSCQMTLSAKEREYAGYMYSRPRLNADPDIDPPTAVNLAPMRVR